MRTDRANLLEACHQVVGEYSDSSGARPRQAHTHSRASLPTVSACVRRFCLDCLGAISGRGAFDCGSTVCPLRPASPFLGKPMPESFRPPTSSDEPPRVPRRRPSRRLILAQCRQCQPGDQSDCEAMDCALYPFRPWAGPGKAPRRKPTQKQLAHWRQQGERLKRFREPPMQNATTAVGGAFDG